jgi:predicted nucleic acid-binding protein
MTLWWGTWAECAVAISRLRRERRLDSEGEEKTRAVLGLLAESWVEVEPSDDLRLLASLLSRDHPLNAADALQLAAALRWCEGNTAGAGFVCLDNQLRRAASDEGFDVLPEEPV